MILLGVDGGGTKTAFVLVEDSGVVLACAQQPSAYYLQHGLDQVRTQRRDRVGGVIHEYRLVA